MSDTTALIWDIAEAYAKLCAIVREALKRHWVTVPTKWAQNPRRSEEAVFREYAERKLGLKGQDVDRFRQLCLLSARGMVAQPPPGLKEKVVGWFHSFNVNLPRPTFLKRDWLPLAAIWRMIAE